MGDSLMAPPSLFHHHDVMHDLREGECCKDCPKGALLAYPGGPASGIAFCGCGRRGPSAGSVYYRPALTKIIPPVPPRTTDVSLD